MVLLEDTAALVGLVLALVGVSLAVVTGNGRWDGLGSLSIGLLLVVIAVFLAMEMNSLLIGEAASPTRSRAIRSALEATPEVLRVIHLRTLHLGPDEILVGCQGRRRPRRHRRRRRPRDRRRRAPGAQRRADGHRHLPRARHRPRPGPVCRCAMMLG